MKKKCIRALLGLAIAVNAIAASAQSDSSIYLGAQAGKSHFTNGCSFGPGPCKDRDTAGRFFVGLQFNRWLGLEGGYADFGKFTVAATNIKANAADIVGVLTVPIQGRFGAYLKGGAYHSEMKTEAAAVRKDGGTFGWGLQYNAGRSGAVRAEYQRYVKMGGGDLSDTTHVDLITVGILFRIQ